MIQASEPGRRIMRYELTDCEWTAIRPLPPNKPRGVPRADAGGVPNGFFWILGPGAPGRVFPESFGLYPLPHHPGVLSAPQRRGEAAPRHLGLDPFHLAARR